MSKRTLHRREFLGRSLALGAGVWGLGGSLSTFLNPGRLWAAGDDDDGFTPKDHHFVFYYFRGGWDILLSWDPRDPELFNETNMGETGIQPGYQFLNIKPPAGVYVDSNIGPLGGFVGDLRLPKYTDKLCVVRGINMETLSHEGGRLRFLTGRMPLGPVPTRDSTDVVMASLLGESNLVPNISLGTESFNNKRDSFATALSASSTAELAQAMTRDNGLAASLEDQIQLLMDQQAGCPHVAASSYLTRANGARTKVDEMLVSGLGQLFDFTLQTDEIVALRSHYGFTKSQLGSVEAMTALVEQALVQQVSRCISIDVPGYFDTHGTLEQGPDQMKAYNAIARLIDNLEEKEYPDGSGDSWLDRTTIMCFSEFCRTPIVNKEMGRDHWLTNCCVLAGGGIKGNQVIGQSSDVGLTPRPLDLATGVFDAAGTYVTPDHIVRALYTMIGYSKDVADLRVEPLTAMLKGF